MRLLHPQHLAYRPRMALFKHAFVSGLRYRLGGISLRLKVMVGNDVRAQIISLNPPTAQAFVKAEEAIDFCHEANQYVYEKYC